MRRAICFVAAVGCVGCTADFLPASLIVAPRVVAVTAEPPEATPGARVTLTPTVVDVDGELAPVTPDSEGFKAVWWRCPDSDSDALGDYDQCTVPADRRDIATGSPYVDAVPADLFGDLAAAAGGASLPPDKLLGALLGYWRVVGLTMSTETKRIDAFKRIPVYLPGRLGDVDPKLAALDSH